MQKRVERGQLDDHKKNGMFKLRILDGIVWDYAQTKCSLF